MRERLSLSIVQTLWTYYPKGHIPYPQTLNWMIVVQSINPNLMVIIHQHTTCFAHFIRNHNPLSTNGYSYMA